MTSTSSTVHAAVDTGGTFTDIGIRLPDGSLFVWKVPSTPDAPDKAVVDGLLGALREVDHTPADITRLVHGTTVATNTVLTRTGARVGLVTTSGFRDVLAIAHQARPALYDNSVHRSAPLIDDKLIVEITERIDARGTVLEPLRDDALEALAENVRALELDSVVVSLLNSYVNDSHEKQVVEFLRERGVAPSVVGATSITAEMREYDRTSTATINAYVQPIMSRYLGKLNEAIATHQIGSPLWIMQSNGGLLNPTTAAEHSARTVLSGLAGGVVGAANWARQLGKDQVVSFDIGGTSTDIALIRDGQPDETVATTIDSLPLRLPSVDVHTIGAGGGSVAWLDSGGSLRVGPHSAGAVPGPISYSRGGTELTVTDAHVVLGRLGTDLLGGRFQLDRDAAHARMREWSNRLNLSPEECAEGILKVITATTARGVRKVSIERGVDVRSCHLMAFGGAGPLHGSDLITELAMESAIIPPNPGIASAVGMLDAPIRHDFAAAVSAADTAGLQELGGTVAELRAQAAAEIGRKDFREEFFFDARYVGQSHELTVSYTDDFVELRRRFDAAHDARYGFSDPDASLEVVVLRLTATIGTGGGDSPRLEAVVKRPPTPKTSRLVYIDGEWVDTPIYDRADLAAGATVSGPAVLDQFDSTTFVRPDQDCAVDEYGFLHLYPRER